jgi:SOS-response transcriptional repressor LexA
MPDHNYFANLIWQIADLLRGPYRPPQYERVMLPMTVLRRFDCVLADTKAKVLAEYRKRKGGKLEGEALDTKLNQAAVQRFHNHSDLDFEKLKGDPDHIEKHLVSYIKGFSANVRRIFDFFEFENEIERMREANILYLVVSKFCDVDLHPSTVKNEQMGLIFENLIRRFNELANETAGDHFTPREVIRLMVSILFINDDKLLATPGTVRKLLDPACGTGGMLAEAQNYLREHHAEARLFVYGQDYNIQAVQSLSRLNRIHPLKEDTFVLDFVNDREEIREAFKTYYEGADMGEEVEPARMYQIKGELDASGIYLAEEVERFCAVYFKPKQRQSLQDHQAMNAALDPAVSRFSVRQKDNEEEAELWRGKVQAFRNLYGFLSQVIPYRDSDLERLYVFLRHLAAKLARRKSGPAYQFDDEVRLEYYRLQKISEGSISLREGGSQPLDGPTEVGSGLVRSQAVPLSQLIDVVNERFGTDFNQADQLFFDQIVEAAMTDDGLRRAAAVNPGDKFELVFRNLLERLFVERMDQNEEIFVRFMNDVPFQRIVTGCMASEAYRRLRTDTSEANGSATSSARPTPFRVVEPGPKDRYVTCVPLVPLKAAAGAFGDPRNVQDDGFEWVAIDTRHRLRPGMFIAQVVGKSMEPAIPDGSYCLFAWPADGSRQGKTVLVELRDAADPETGQRYTIKRYESAKERDGDTWRHTKITLKPNNPDFQPIVLTGGDEDEVRIVAELVEVLADEA